MVNPKIEEKLESAAEPVVEQTSRLKSFTVNHPRTAKVVGIAAITAVTLGAVQAWKTYKLESEETETLEGEVISIDDSSKTA